MEPNTEDRARITTRLPVTARDRLNEAAALRGTTVNAFVIQAALKEAEEVIEKDRVIKLTEQSARKIIDLMENPPAPNARLLAAVKAAKESVRDES